MIQKIFSILYTAAKDILDAITRFLWVLIRAMLIFLCLGLIAVITIQIYTHNFLSQQDYKDITQRDAFAQTSYIQDINGKTLYGFFEEDREYIALDTVSNTLIQAIISAEDKTFWSNPGYDSTAMIRAARNNFSQLLANGTIHQLQGGSTITQQLIKNINLGTQKTLQRKVNEIILAEEFTDILVNHVQKNNPDLSYSQQFYLAKKYVLELYLNYIFLGNHSYGVESAAKKYFGKSSSDLSIGESSIIASLPKAPSTYDPYTNRDALMGYRIVQEDQFNKTLPHDMHQEIKALLQHQLADAETKQNTINALRELKKNHSLIDDFFASLVSIIINSERSSLQLHYIPGRKDYVLGQMYLNNHINEEDMINAFVDTIDQEFLPVKFPIKAPHFVYRVRDLLFHDPQFAEIGITEQDLSIGGYTITTTLDYDMQTQIEQLILNNSFLLQHYNGNNRAILITDPRDGTVQSYIGSSDFRNDEIEGKNDLVKSEKQPGSTIKPFVYAYSMMEYAIGPHSKILDDKLRIGDYEPQNADGKFRGYTTIAKALAGSRNIPALKLFQANGAESVMKPFLKEIGFNTLDDDHNYGLSLAIGGGETNMLELSQAYAHLAHTGATIPGINPILEIKNTDGEILYKRDKEEFNQKDTSQRSIPLGVSWLVRNILSQQKNAPSGRYNMLSVPNLKNYAIKTGTSDKKVRDENGEEQTRPKDGWLVMYNPSTIITMRAGNTDGSAMNDKAFGGTLNAPLLQDIVKMMTEQGYLQDQEMFYPEDQLTKGRYAHPTNDRRPASIAQ